MKKTSFILGLIAGLLGIIGSVALFIIGALQKVTDVTGKNMLVSAVIAVISAIVGLVSAITVEKNSIVCGLLMIVSAIVGFVYGYVFYAITSILFIIAAVFAFIPNKKEEASVLK